MNRFDVTDLFLLCICLTVGFSAVKIFRVTAIANWSWWLVFSPLIIGMLIIGMLIWLVLIVWIAYSHD